MGARVAKLIFGINVRKSVAKHCAFIIVVRTKSDKDLELPFLINNKIKVPAS